MDETATDATTPTASEKTEPPKLRRICAAYRVEVRRLESELAEARKRLLEARREKFHV